MTVPKRFGVLRFIGTLLKVIAWIVLILAILGAIGAAVLSGGIAGDTFAQILPEGMTLPANGILAAILFVVGGIIYFLILFAAGESLHMQLAVEENTRLTAALLLRLHQESQVDGSAAYGGGGGFANEPFDR